MSIKTLKKLETAGENKKARHKAGLPTGAQFISDEKRYHADAETQVPLDSAKACAAKFCGRMGKGDKNSELVHLVKEKVDQQYDDGRVTVMTDAELTEMINDCCQKLQIEL